MNACNELKGVMSVPSGVGSAVGMGEGGKSWYVAIVKNNTEKSVVERLEAQGRECYAPIQEETKVWKNGRKATVRRIVIPSLVFVHCTERERRELVSYPYILRFMTNRSGLSHPGGNKPLAVVPDAQIRTLQFMVGNSDTPVTLSSQAYKRGDYVRVVRGRLSGLEGEVQALDDKRSEIIVGLDFLGNARLTINTVDIELVNHK